MNVSEICNGLRQRKQDEAIANELELRKLHLADAEFENLSELVREETHKHALYLQQRYGTNRITLQDQNALRITVETADSLCLATITFSALWHQVTVKTQGTTPLVSYTFQVGIKGANDLPYVTWRKYDCNLGLVSEYEIVRALREALDALVILKEEV